MTSTSTTVSQSSHVALPVLSGTAIVSRAVLGALLVAVLAWAWTKAEMNPIGLINDSGNMAKMMADFVPPDFSDWRYALDRMAETIAIAVWGTVLAVIVGIPFGILSATNIVPAWIALPVRRLMDALRATNELVFALIFITAVGLGPFAGVMAIFVHTTGVVAKLFSEAVEAMETGPVEGVRATGATWLQEVIHGVLPQVLPLWVSYALYRFEGNVRSATVIGLVGGGGIGMTFNEAMRSFNYPQASAILVIIVVAVVAIDVASQRIRKILV